MLAPRQDAGNTWWTPSPGDGAYTAATTTDAVNAAAAATTAVQSEADVASQPSQDATESSSSSEILDNSADATDSATSAATDDDAAAVESTTSTSEDQSLPSNTDSTSSSEVASSVDEAESSSQPSASSQDPSLTLSQDQIKAVSISDLPSSSSADPEPSSDSSSTATHSSSAHNAMLNQGNFFKTIGSNPTYIGLTVLVSCTVLVCIVAFIACLLRRRNRNRHAGRLNDPFASVHDDEHDDLERRESFGSDDSILAAKEMREADWVQPQSAVWSQPQPVLNTGAWTGEKAAYALPAPVKPSAHFPARHSVEHAHASAAPVLAARVSDASPAYFGAPKTEASKARQNDSFTNFRSSRGAADTSLRRKLQRQQIEQEMMRNYLATHQATAPANQQAALARTPSDASSAYTASSYHSEAPVPVPAVAQIPRYRTDSLRRTDNRSSWEYLAEDQERATNKASRALQERLGRNQTFYC